MPLLVDELKTDIANGTVAPQFLKLLGRKDVSAACQQTTTVLEIRFQREQGRAS